MRAAINYKSDKKVKKFGFICARFHAIQYSEQKYADPARSSEILWNKSCHMVKLSPTDVRKLSIVFWGDEKEFFSSHLIPEIWKENH